MRSTGAPFFAAAPTFLLLNYFSLRDMGRTSNTNAGGGFKGEEGCLLILGILWIFRGCKEVSGRIQRGKGRSR